MAAKTKCESMSDFRKSIRKAKLQGHSVETNDLNVLSVHRYLYDPKHGVQTGVKEGQGQCLDVLEVTIADVKYKLKVILAPKLNTLVQTCKLQAGDTIRITKCHLHFDETDLSGSSVIIVEELDITGHTAIQHNSELQGLVWCDDCSHIEQMDLPLTSSRGYYVSVWSSMEMYGQIWKTLVPLTNGLGSTTVQDIYTIKDLSRKWSTVKVANPVVLVRVLMKSRLIHYAKPAKNDKWPFQAHMLIGDHTGACTAVFWNATCPNYYHSIKVGSVLLLQKFNIKKGFQQVTRFKPALKNTEFFDIDLNINSHHPVTEVKVIDPASLPSPVKLPPLEYNFVTRKQAGCLPDNYICDIAGVVTYVGRYEREPMINKYGKDTGGFWVRRWLHLVDGSSPNPFCLQIYKMAEGLEELDIHPGQLIVCTHTRVVQKYGYIDKSYTGRYGMFTSTAESQISILTTELHSELADEVVVTDLWAWSKSDLCRSTLTHAYIGGYYNYPPLPSNIDQVKECMKDFQVISSDEWERVLSSFSYREGRQLLMMATMVQVKVKLTSSGHDRETKEKGKSPKKKRKLTQLEVTLDPAVFAESDVPLTMLGSEFLDQSKPVLYKPDQWEAVRQRLRFPSTELEECLGIEEFDTDQLDYLQFPYFTIMWLGLNSKVLLQSHLPFIDNLNTSSTFLDILSKSGYSKNPWKQVTDSGLDTDFEGVTTSARQCSDQRFLLVLDCYKGDQDTIEIMLNRALPLT